MIIQGAMLAPHHVACALHALCVFTVSSLVTTSYLHAAYWRARPPPMWLLIMFGLRLCVDISGCLASTHRTQALPCLMLLESLAVLMTRTSRHVSTYDELVCNTCAVLCLFADALLLLYCPTHVLDNTGS